LTGGEGAGAGRGEGIRVLLAAHQSLALGGIGTMAKGLAEHLPEAIGSHGTVVVAMPNRGRRLSRLGSPGAAARVWHEQVRLARMAGDFDLVHLCDLRPLALTRTPFLITVHDVDFLDRPQWFPAGARHYKARMLAAALRKRPAAIVCVSEHTRGRLLHHFPDANRSELRVIHPGVEQPAAQWTGAGDPPFLLTVSTIHPRKNHLGLLRAYREARRRGLELRWRVAGPAGPRSREIRRALAAEPGVEVLGAVEPAELDRLYRQATFVATPSALEGFGYPPLEAMARGTPTLSSNAASLPEIVGDAAPLLAPDDVDAWAQALVWLAGDADARDRLSESGRARAARFSWQRPAESIVRLYREIRG
jgi:glycosyltransferase involved in cell wall biosynthesis